MIDRQMDKQIDLDNKYLEWIDRETNVLCRIRL